MRPTAQKDKKTKHTEAGYKATLTILVTGPICYRLK